MFSILIIFSLTIWALSHNKDSLIMCVNKFKHYKWILQSSAQLILSSWIQKCLWIWKIAVGRWSHLLYLHRLWLHFLPCKWFPILGDAVPNFLDRCKLLLHLPFRFLHLCFIPCDKLKQWCQWPVTFYSIFFIFGAFYVFQILNCMTLSYINHMRSNKRTLQFSFVGGFYKGICKLGFNC